MNVAGTGARRPALQGVAYAFDTTAQMIATLSRHLCAEYARVFGRQKPHYADTIDTAARLSLERIATSDALYHNVDHTVMVTLVGTEILRGRELCESVTPEDWLHLTVALLCHDVGYVRGACRGDSTTEVVTGMSGERATLPRGASDAWLTPYHVDRGKIFVHERADVLGHVDPERVAAAIELTRFPVPTDEDRAECGGESGLVRASDLIGQLADPNYLRKQTALYYEFLETGTASRLGFTTPADLAEGYVKFFWSTVEPYIGQGLRYLQLTPQGRQWIANLYAQVFTVEHARWHMGPSTGKPARPGTLP
jgi:hypothetical protein